MHEQNVIKSQAVTPASARSRPGRGAPAGDRVSLLSRMLGPRRRTVALEERVRACMLAGDLPTARALVEEALALAPRAAAVHHLSGLVALREGRPDVAVAHLQTASASEPDSAQIRYDFAEALRVSGRPAEALDMYQAVLRAIPELPEALLGLAEALADAGDVATARLTLERAMARMDGGTDDGGGANRRRAGLLAARLRDPQSADPA